MYYLLSQGGWDLARLIELATRKSLDFEQEDFLLELGALLISCSEAPYLRRMGRLRFTRPADVQAIGKFLRSQGEELLDKLKPEG